MYKGLERQIKRAVRSNVRATMVFVSSICIISNSFAANFTALRIFPENVGVFTEVGTQQFVAFGFNSDTNTWDNITTQVTWESSSEQHVSFDENGLATVKDTSGIVRVRAIYPKITTPNVPVLAPIYDLLNEE